MNTATPQPDPGRIEELARLLPVPVERDLPVDRRRPLKEFMMQEIQRDTRPGERVRRHALRRPAFLAPVLAAAVALAVAVPVLVSGGAPAYAVARNPDGTISVRINEIRDAKKLEADLNALGFKAVVDYVPQGKQCEDPRGDDLLPSERSYGRAADNPLVIIDRGGVSEKGFIFNPAALEEGQTAVLEFNIGDPTVHIWARIANGPVRPCVMADTTGYPVGPSEVPGTPAG
ncbi:hypothetical protein ACIBCT_00370 [Streptosporangium sp. NPDC050855]|uniref:hypothetical protein n=1 Tax=Streptosporangium sp. NPDC050855 TaxID=3366194 RepID=UPI0037964C0C